MLVLVWVLVLVLVMVQVVVLVLVLAAILVTVLEAIMLIRISKKMVEGKDVRGDFFTTNIGVAGKSP